MAFAWLRYITVTVALSISTGIASICLTIRHSRCGGTTKEPCRIDGRAHPLLTDRRLRIDGSRVARGWLADELQLGRYTFSLPAFYHQALSDVSMRESKKGDRARDDLN
jgi:hypothetical protein